MIRSEIGDYRIGIYIERKHPDGGTYKENIWLDYKEAKKFAEDLKNNIVGLRTKIKGIIDE